MKRIIHLLLIIIPLTGACQTSSSNQIDIVGIWTLTELNNPNKFENTWEFKSDNVFNELKYKTDGDTNLVPDENGTWSLENTTLKLTITGEKINGKQKLFEKPQILKFDVSKKGTNYILNVINRKVRVKNPIKLQLTKKKIT